MYCNEKRTFLRNFMHPNHFTNHLHLKSKIVSKFSKISKISLQPYELDMQYSYFHGKSNPGNLKYYFSEYLHV